MLTDKKIAARIEALESAASFLQLTWTDDETEMEQGQIVAAQLRKQIDKLVDKQIKINNNHGRP